MGPAGGRKVAVLRDAAAPLRVLVSHTGLPETTGPAVVDQQAPGKGQDQFRELQVIHRGLGQIFQVILQVIGQKSQTPGGQGMERRLPRQFQGPQ